MRGDVVRAGLLGGLVMMVWLFISNAILPIKCDLIHNVAPDQIALHAALKASIRAPGTYSCPYLGPDEEHLLDDYRSQPVYTITYSGYTHGSGLGAGFLLPFGVVFAAAFLAAWLVAQLSTSLLASYGRKVLFVAAIGLLVALSDDLLQLSFGPQSKDYLLFLAVNHVVTWVLGGVVIASRVRPSCRAE